MEFKYYNIKEIQNYLKTNNIVLQKKFGQNFLINAGAAGSILDKINISKNDLVLEIGCGIGNLTNKILEKGCKVIGFELDKEYIKILKTQFASYNFELVEGDFLKNAKKIFASIDKSLYERIILIGNLPYYITREIFEKVFTSNLHFDICCFMVQKEVTERIMANVKDERYSYFSIISQVNKDVKLIASLSPDSFFPTPNVSSDMILFTRNEKYKITDESLFFRLSKSLFLSRRKKILNNLNLSSFLSETEKKIIPDALTNQGISTDIRGEILSIEEIAKLSNEISKLIIQ
jgi:16S rRNA (adenine1518-N6/adenine1519-N6)-dimethyltransferase